MPGLQVKLLIIVPERQVLERQVDMVVLPALEGELGVLAGHAPALAQLGEGILHYRAGEEKGAFAVLGGFAEIYRNKVSVFAEGAELADEIDEETERQAIQKAKQILASRGGDMDLDAAQAQLRKSLLRMKLVQRKNAH